jgi:hypothetical protein
VEVASCELGFGGILGGETSHFSGPSLGGGRYGTLAAKSDEAYDEPSKND